jgi:hypothetical protein
LFPWTEKEVKMVVRANVNDRLVELGDVPLVPRQGEYIEIGHARVVGTVKRVYWHFGKAMGAVDWVEVML